MRAGLSERRVVEAAAELADELGFEQLTLSAVARRFGVQVASLYSHVAGADDVRAGVACLALEELADSAASALAGRSGAEALVALGNVYRDYAARHPGRYDAARFPLTPEAAAASAGPRLAEMTRAVLRGYELGKEDETHAVRLLGSVFHGFVSLEAAGGFSHSRPSSRRSWERILDGLDAMLRSWAATTDRPTRTRRAPG